LRDVAAYAAAFLDGVNDRPVRASSPVATLRDALGGGPLPSSGSPAATVFAELVAAGEPGVVASNGPRFFGFVTGASLPAATAADWVVSTWDQNAGPGLSSPVAVAVEDVVGAWLLEVLGLPAASSFTLTTGAQMANVVGLAAARHAVLSRAGWDVERDGLWGAPPVRVVAGRDRHVTLDRALRYLGMGTACVEPVATDDIGAMLAPALRDVLSTGDPARPVIVCAQAGEVNAGGFDPFDAVCEAAHERGAWVHVDGAFGLWAAAAPSRRDLVGGVEHADSWATDAHKWLNVPYDCGVAVVRHPDAHRGATATTAAYLATSADRDPMQWSPEASRRARAIPVWAALRSLGRDGVADLVERCCVLATRFADRLAATGGVEVLNPEPPLNQVLVRFGDSDEVTARVVAGVQDAGVCWMGGTVWRGRAAMRISVSSWRTTADDVDRSVGSILEVLASVT
jgi:glutamate/tyrosine decarboxylase-like PLP-dependent enzyme